MENIRDVLPYPRAKSLEF